MKTQARFNEITGRRPVALVTGCARRVGRATSIALARAGCDIVGTYLSSEDGAVELGGTIREAGAGYACERLDLSDPVGACEWASGTAACLPRLDVLVHNASMYEPTPLGEVSAEQLESFYRVNAASPLMLSIAFSGLLKSSGLPGGGAIVAMSDIHAVGRPRRTHVAYSMSKAALTEMVRTLAVALAPAVRVNAVAPGVVAFPESGHESDPESQRRYLKRVALGRAGTPEEAAEAVRWLALEATYTTGQVLRVDGGRWLD